MSDDILDVDLLAFEQGGAKQRKAVVDGVMRSLATGFVYTSHDLSEDMLDTTYSMLYEFFNKPIDEKRRYIAPGANGQTGYTDVLVETAEVSDKPDWKEMLNWGKQLEALLNAAPVAGRSMFQTQSICLSANELLNALLGWNRASERVYVNPAVRIRGAGASTLVELPAVEGAAGIIFRPKAAVLAAGAGNERLLAELSRDPDQHHARPEPTQSRGPYDYCGRGFSRRLKQDLNLER